jgi:ABC-type multidrug transport system fused ATPase/permease subunit
MRPGANHFFFFMGILIGLEFVGQSCGRVFVSLMRKQVSATALSSVVILIFGSIAGFMPSYGEITWVLRWLSWLTPASYAFEALMLNEFAGRDGPTTEGGGLSLTLTGDEWLSTAGMPRASWGSPTAIKIFDLFMLFVLSMIYDLIGLYYVEQTRNWFYHQIRRPQSRVKSFAMAKESKAKNSSDGGGVDDSGVPGVGAGDSTAADDAWPRSLSVRSLRYSVPLKTKRSCTRQGVLGPWLVKLSGNKKADETVQPESLTLLNGIDARFQRGRMTALMGSSGAGKTTLLGKELMKKNDESLQNRLTLTCTHISRPQILCRCYCRLQDGWHYHG